MKEKIIWSKQTAAEKRVTLCKDVLKGLKTGKIKATSGRYFENQYDFIERWDWENRLVTPKEQLQPKLLAKDAVCHVCQKGALFVCDIMRNNKYKVNNESDLDDEEVQSGRLKKWFTGRQLDLMELAFEKFKKGDWISEYDNDEEFDKARKFATGNVTARIEAIMKNVIKNKGIFKP